MKDDRPLPAETCAVLKSRRLLAPALRLRALLATGLVAAVLPAQAQTIVDECAKDKVSSSATTHKKLGQLKKLGFVREVKHDNDKDGRKCYIQITEGGMAYR